MPVCFQFTRVSTGEPMTLEQIDVLMCSDTERNVDPKIHCPMFIWTQLLGVAAVRMDGGCTPDNVRKKCQEYNLSDRETELAVKYLSGEFQFDSWWSPT